MNTPETSKPGNANAPLYTAHENFLGQTADSSSEKRHEHFTHRSVTQIINALGMGPWERALLWLSKTDIYALTNCTYHTRLTLSALGLMVLFTSTLALISGYTTLSLIIDPQVELKVFIALAGAVLYSFGIMIIDREIVGNPSHRAVWIRLLFAFVIATAVSYPIKLKLLDGPIKAEISAMIEERNSQKLQRVDELRNLALTEKNNQIKAKEEQLAGIKAQMRELGAQIHDERTNIRLGAICDKRCEAAKAQLLVYQGLENKALKEMETLRGEDGLTPNAQAEVKRLMAEVDKQKSEAFDFLSYWQAQDRIMRKDQSGARVLSYFLFFFFFVLELVPVGLKYALGTSEYHQYLEARHRLNLQKIAAITNMLLTIIRDAKSPGVILRLPPELTDLICYLMEDTTVPMELNQHFLALFAKGGPTPGAPPRGDGQPPPNAVQAPVDASSTRARDSDTAPAVS